MPRVVLIYPEIPPNTGNIARSCAATGTELHLIEPLGFKITDRYLKRAGIDYWPYVDVTCHSDWDTFHQMAQARGGRYVGFMARGQKNYWDIHYQAEDWLIFGSESSGIPPEIAATCDESVYIPMPQAKVRSLNLSVSAALGLFEAYRQLTFAKDQ